MAIPQATETELEMKKVAREFAEREIKPVVLKREWLDDPNGRVPWDIFEKAARLGIKALTVPEEYGGIGASTLGMCMVAEEIARADPGIAVAMGHWWKEIKLIAKLGSREQKDWFFPMFMKDDRFLLATTMTEPAYGSDNLLPYEEHSLNTTARLEGDRWVINGHKIFISNGAIAKLYVVYAATNPNKSFSEGTSCFLVPRDSPGVKVGAVFDKMGLRLLNNAEVIFENCRVPKENLLGEVDKGLIVAREFFKGGGLLAASYALGCAQGAYEAALEYAKERRQGGKLIINHQAVGMRLAKMATLIEACRSLIYRSAWAADNDANFDPKLGPMSRYYAGEVCREVCELAIQTFGCTGVMMEMPIQKYVRDALCCLHLDGTQDVQLLKIMKRL